MEAKHIESCFYANRLDHNTHNGDMKMYLHEKKHCLFIHTYGWHGSYSFAFLNATEHQMVMRKHSPIAIQTVNFASEINCLIVLFFSSLHILYGAKNEMQSPAFENSCIYAIETSIGLNAVISIVSYEEEKITSPCGNIQTQFEMQLVNINLNSVIDVCDIAAKCSIIEWKI